MDGIPSDAETERRQGPVALQHQHIYFHHLPVLREGERVLQGSIF